MSRRLTLRPLAEADLQAIWEHTAEAWTVAQAEDYLLGLGRLFALLTDHPDIARLRLDLVPPVRMHPYHSHVVIFTNDAAKIEVIRVVHARSNWRDLLAE